MICVPSFLEEILYSYICIVPGRQNIFILYTIDFFSIYIAGCDVSDVLNRSSINGFKIEMERVIIFPFISGFGSFQ